MRIDPSAFHARDLRVHSLLHDVPLEDVWAIPLTGGGQGRTIDDLRNAFMAGRQHLPALVTGLVQLRGRIGTAFGWDRPNPAWDAESFATRLTSEDRGRTMAAPGSADGRLNLLYRFPNEQLSEKRNGTVHAFSSYSIGTSPEGYLGYLAVYVRPVHRLTWLYMALIRPFRRWVVYPALIRQAQAAWAARYGAALATNSR